MNETSEADGSEPEADIVALRLVMPRAEAAIATGRSSNSAQGRLKDDPAWHRFAGPTGRDRRTP